jgi:hypothetical protein
MSILGQSTFAFNRQTNSRNLVVASTRRSARDINIFHDPPKSSERVNGHVAHIVVRILVPKRPLSNIISFVNNRGSPRTRVLTANDNKTKRELKSNSLWLRQPSSLVPRSFVFTCLSFSTSISSQLVRQFDRLRSCLSSPSPSSQIASFEDLESNNVSNDNVVSNDEFKNISKYEISNNEEAPQSQLASSSSQQLIKPRRTRNRAPRDPRQHGRNLPNTHIIARTSNTSMKLYVLSTLR